MMKQFRLPDPPPELRTRILERMEGLSTRANDSAAPERRGHHWGRVLIAVACFLLAGVIWTIVASSFGGRSSQSQSERSAKSAIPADADSGPGQDPKNSPVRKMSEEAKERVLKNVSDTADDLRRLVSQDSTRGQNDLGQEASHPFPDELKCKIRRAGNNVLVELKLLSRGKVLHEPTLATLPGQWSKIWVGDKLTAWEFDQKKDEELKLKEVEVIGSGSLIVVRCNLAKDGQIDVKLRSHYFANTARVWSIEEELQLADGEERTLRKRMTIHARDQDVREIIKTIERASGRKITVSPEVKGSVTFSINNVPWEEVLSAIAKTLNYAVITEKDGTIRVGTPEGKK
jgi:type II secretion system GspD-like secretin